jgi:FkbM family methyltransferase
MIRLLLVRHKGVSELSKLIHAEDQSMLARRGALRIRATRQRESLRFVDVGARGDLHPIAREYLKTLSLLLIEPDWNAAEELVRQNAPHPNVEVKCCAVGSSNSDATLFETLKPGGTSTLMFGGVMSPLIQRNHPDSDRFSIVRSVGIRLQPLSSICQTIDILKIDTQGTSQDVLMGLGPIRPLIIQLEAETVEIYREEKTIFAVAEYLRTLGYMMLKNDIQLEPLLPRSNPEYRLSTQISGDCYFVPDLSILGRAIIGGREKEFLLACCMFGFQDYADWILSK